MSAEVERLSWRESIAAQLYALADSWLRDEMRHHAAMDALDEISARIDARLVGEQRIAAGMGMPDDAAREMEWR